MSRHVGRNSLARIGLSLAGLLAAAASLHANAQSTSLPPEQQAGVASFVSGGIGDGESHRFEAAFGRYPLVVQVFEHVGATNEYTADAKVTITDRHGNVVLDRAASGPFMLVRLPAGDYRVGVQLQGRTLPERPVHVTDSGHAKATFVFPHDGG